MICAPINTAGGDGSQKADLEYLELWFRGGSPCSGSGLCGVGWRKRHFSPCWDESVVKDKEVMVLLKSRAFCSRQQIYFSLPPQKRISKSKSYLGDYLNKLSSGHLFVSVVHEWDEKVFSAHNSTSRLFSVSDVWYFGYHCFVLAAVIREQHHLTPTGCHRRASKEGKEDDHLLAIPLGNTSLSLKLSWMGL